MTAAVRFLPRDLPSVSGAGCGWRGWRRPIQSQSVPETENQSEIQIVESTRESRMVSIARWVDMVSLPTDRVFCRGFGDGSGVSWQTHHRPRTWAQ